MSTIPADLRYTKDHEWVKSTADGSVLIGITDYAQQSLGDITFVDLPKAGAQFSQGESFGVVESVKAASDLYMPLSGEVLEVNSDLETAPESVNQDPYGAAWMVKLKPAAVEELEQLLDAAAYQALTASL